MRIYSAGGHGLVVERILAKDKTGFRLPLAAPKIGFRQKRLKRAVFALRNFYCRTGDKGVGSGDKGRTSVMLLGIWSYSLASKYAVFIKAVDISSKTRKEVGNLGEKVAAEYLRRHGFSIRDRNVTRKTGELDIVAEKENTLCFVEVKTNVVEEFPSEEGVEDDYDPSLNLHETKIRKVARTGEWYVLEKHWEGEWQVDGCLVWLRRRDGMAKVRYLPQIV